MPFKAYIDISRVLERLLKGRLPTGVDRVILAYVLRWGGVAQALLQKGRWRRVLPVRESRKLFDLLLTPPERFNQRVWQQIARATMPPWPSQCLADGFSFHLGQTGVDQPGFEGWVRHSRQRPVFFVHDLLPLEHPEYFAPDHARQHAARIEVMLRLGQALIANSDATREAITRFAHTRQLPLPPIATAALAPAPLPPASAEGEVPPLAGPYFVVLGTIEPRKNHLLLLNVWREMLSRNIQPMPKLVVVGQRGWECEQVVDMLDRCEVLRPHLIEVPRCSDAALAGYLRHARALLFPTFAEGYGMPLVEALSLGTPVIASRLPVFHEVAGEVPDLLSPIDGEGWLAAVVDYCAPDGRLRPAQLLRLRRHQAPTWNGHFRAVERLLGPLL